MEFSEPKGEMTEEEYQEVERRRTITIENKDELSKESNKEETQKKFIEFMMSEDPDQEIQDRRVAGLNFSKNGVCEINKDQKELEDIILELNQKMITV